MRDEFSEVELMLTLVEIYPLTDHFRNLRENHMDYFLRTPKEKKRKKKRAGNLIKLIKKKKPKQQTN